MAADDTTFVLRLEVCQTLPHGVCCCSCATLNYRPLSLKSEKGSERRHPLSIESSSGEHSNQQKDRPAPNLSPGLPHRQLCAVGTGVYGRVGRESAAWLLAPGQGLQSGTGGTCIPWVTNTFKSEVELQQVFFKIISVWSSKLIKRVPMR